MDWARSGQREACANLEHVFSLSVYSYTLAVVWRISELRE